MGRGPTVRYSEDVASRIERLAALGMTQADAGYILSISADTIQRHYAEAWNKGKAKAKANIAGKLYEKAMAGDSASIFFYLKTQAGWREVQRVDHTSSDGTMTPQPAINIDFGNMTPEQLTEMGMAFFRGKKGEGK